MKKEERAKEEVVKGAANKGIFVRLFAVVIVCLIVLHYVMEEVHAISENTTKWCVVLLTVGRPPQHYIPGLSCCLGSLRPDVYKGAQTAFLSAVFRVRPRNYSARPAFVKIRRILDVLRLV